MLWCFEAYTWVAEKSSHWSSSRGTFETEYVARRRELFGDPFNERRAGQVNEPSKLLHVPNLILKTRNAVSGKLVSDHVPNHQRGIGVFDGIE
jgi:hypothetical protein